MDSSANDIALFNRVKKADHLALNTLFVSYYQRLCTFANSYLERKEEAEEVVADVFVNLWQNRERLKIESNVKAYLYVCVRNACLALLRKVQPVFEDIHEEEIGAQLIQYSDPESRLQYIELDAYIEATLLRLPPGCRQVFIMSRYDGLKYKEISEILSVSEKTVENQLIKALSFLRHHLQQYRSERTHHRSIA